MSESFEEITQELITALHEMLVGRCPEEGAWFALRNAQSYAFYGGNEISISHFKGDTQFP